MENTNVKEVFYMIIILLSKNVFCHANLKDQNGDVFIGMGKRLKGF